MPRLPGRGRPTPTIQEGDAEDTPSPRTRIRVTLVGWRGGYGPGRSFIELDDGRRINLPPHPDVEVIEE